MVVVGLHSGVLGGKFGDPGMALASLFPAKVGKRMAVLGFGSYSPRIPMPAGPTRRLTLDFPGHLILLFDAKRCGLNTR
jgi:hypothetical protein